MSPILKALIPVALAVPLAAQASPPVVGPSGGTGIVLSDRRIDPDICSRFITAASGPNALIIDVPTAGGDSVYPSTGAAPTP